MTIRTVTTWLGCCLALLLAGLGCSGDTNTGALSLSLELANGGEIDEVSYRITSEGMEPMEGVIDTSAPGATASVEVFGLPPGTGYVVELAAVADEGSECEGSAPFAVSAGQTTSVMVMLNCKPPERFGGVRVNGKLNVCAHLEKVVASPLQTSVGNSIDLFAQGADAEDDDVDYRWSATSGSISSPNSPISDYTCVVPGRDLILIEVSDDEFRHCVDSWTVEVACVTDGGGAGGAGGAGGGVGTGACINPEDAMTYANLTYTTGAGIEVAGTDAASAIASDCVFGAVNSVPRNPGCGMQAQAVLICAASGCPAETVAALTMCVSSFSYDPSSFG